MYDNMTDQQVRDALALRDQQNASQRQMLDSARSDLRIERQRVANLEARLAVERARASRGRRRMRFW